LYHDKEQGRELQGVPEDSIRAIHVPHRCIAVLLRSKQKDRLEASATRLVKALARESGLPMQHFGVSGSLLVGLHRNHSDLDIMVYGLASAKRVQRALGILLKEDRTFQAYRTSELRKLFMRRHLQQAMTFRDFGLQERRKVFQGTFEGHDYFIRCVKNWEEITEHYGEARFRSIGESEVSGQVVDDNESLLTPCRYVLERVKVLKGHASRRPSEIVSFRGRFTEQAYRGERIFARGRLEAVRTKDQKYFRLVVGEGPVDVLQTIW
jgi:predicted nucleotidyltransferase